MTLLAIAVGVIVVLALLVVVAAVIVRRRRDRVADDLAWRAQLSALRQGSAKPVLKFRGYDQAKAAAGHARWMSETASGRKLSPPRLVTDAGAPIEPLPPGKIIVAEQPVVVDYFEARRRAGGGGNG